MNGAESLVRTLLASGIDTCFANPGTSEMHFVAALDRFPQMRAIPCLHETVVTGAADGYARMLDRPACTLLHCGPGLGNAFANLHNAARADTPMVNIVGDQATWHAGLNPPLASDIEGLARPATVHVRRSLHAADVGTDTARAVAASRDAPGGPVVLALPSDTCWDEGGVEAAVISPRTAAPVGQDAVDTAARLLAAGQAVIMPGGQGLREPALLLLAAISARTGARIVAPTHISRIERGRGRPVTERLPYPVDAARACLAGTRALILAGAPSPVNFFAYPGKPGTPQPEDCITHALARPGEDVLDALTRLAGALGAEPVAIRQAALPELPPAGSAITSASVAAVIEALLPEDAVIVDESISFGRDFFAGTAQAARHDWLQLTGGAIGSGIPMATGAAVACPGRRIVNLQADGSAMYSLQGLWTQAREELDVTTVILSNRRYAILDGELKNVGAAEGPASARLFDLGRPDLDWPGLANSMGVEGARAESLDALADLFARANARPGPFLIELLI